MKQIESGSLVLEFDEAALGVTLKKEGTVWNWRKQYVPRILCEEGEVFFRDFKKITHENFKNGIGTGIRSRYEGCEKNGREVPYEFMLKEPGTPKQGIPVPLYNLVYHDCVIQPWMMDRTEALEPRPPVK